MDFSVNFDFFFLIFKIDTRIHSQKLIFYFYFKLSYSKFARDFKNTQTQTQISKKMKTQTQT